MKIPYVENKNGKLFSFSRHDYKENTDEDGNYIMIDGFGSGYVRYSGDLKEGDIEDLIQEIREQMKWGRNYTKDGKLLEQTEWILLKHLDTDHIVNILSYFNKRAYKKIEDNQSVGNLDTVVDKEWFVMHEIFVQELKYRLNEIGNIRK